MSATRSIMAGVGSGLVAPVVTALVAGCGEGRATLEEIVRLMQRESERREAARDVRLNEPFLEYAFAGDSVTVRRMLEVSPDSARVLVRARDATGMTALHRAVWGGHPAIVQLLLAHGADIEAPDGGGQTAISLAARWGRSGLLDVLLAHGADASATDDMGRTLLHYAAQYGHLEVMRSLLASGFDVDVQSKTGPPLQSAVFGDQLEATRFLLDYGAGLEVRGSRNL